MGIFREAAARVLVVVAVVVGAAALGAWWSSLVLARTASELGSAAHSKAVTQITAQLDARLPGTSQLPSVQRAIDQALRDPKVAAALNSSAPSGSKALTTELKSLDPGLGKVLGGKALNVDLGQNLVNGLAHRLRSGARLGFVAAGILAGAALVLSPLRHLALRHLALGVGVLAGAAILVSWGVPALVGRLTHGSVHRVAMSMLSGGDPVRSVLLACVGVGAGVFLATHVFELLPGPRFRAPNPDLPLPEGKVL